MQGQPVREQSNELVPGILTVQLAASFLSGGFLQIITQANMPCTYEALF